MYDALTTPTPFCPILAAVRMAYGNREDGDPRQHIDGTNLLLPKLRPLREIPHSLARENCEMLVTMDQPKISLECETWASALGFYSGLIASDRMDFDVLSDCLGDTPASDEWDKEGPAKAVGLALQSLGISTHRALQRYTEAHDEAVALVRHIRRHEVGG